MLRYYAGRAVEPFAGGDATIDEQALIGAQKIDKIFQNARDCLHTLHEALSETENRKQNRRHTVKDILRDHESLISELENINIEADQVEVVDR